MKEMNELINSLEDILVKEFRVLQNLMDITKDERLALAERDSDRLMSIVEEKEVLLDQLGLMEENRQVITAKLAKSLGIKKRSYSIADILPELDAYISERLSRLHEGITTLVEKTLIMNRGNSSLAKSKIDWLGAAQNFLLSIIPSSDSYYPPGNMVNQELCPVSGIEHTI